MCRYVLASLLIAWIPSAALAQPASLDELKRSLKNGGSLTASPNRAAFPFKADAAKAHQKAYADWVRLSHEQAHALGMTFVLVPPGTFLMGSPADEPGHNLSG